MQNDEADETWIAVGDSVDCSGPEKQGRAENLDQNDGSTSSQVESVDKHEAPAVISIAISHGDAYNQVSAVPELKAGTVSRTTGSEKDNKPDTVSPMKCYLSRSESCHEQCRVCQQQTEEPLMVLGCCCRGELAKAHRSCIEIWFLTRGSNRCEICQQVAANVPPPESQPSTNYWVWRVDSAFAGSSIGHGERERGCFSPLWVAFSILIGGLLLDVIISISLGVSALPVNIIIGVLIVLGLGTALRLALECSHEWSFRRMVQRVDANRNPGYHPAV